MSEVVTFEREYRCFCRNGRFFCGSSYPLEPYLPVPDHVRGFAETAAARLLTHGSTMVTVDVGVGPDGVLRLVELGGVNSCGIYGSNVADFIAAMGGRGPRPRGRVTRDAAVLRIALLNSIFKRFSE